MAKTRLSNPYAERALFARRAVVAIVLVLMMSCALGAQLVNLQVFSHDHYMTLADGNRMRIEPVPPTRGLIFDRNGVLLAGNQPSFTLEVIPEQVDELDETLRRLAGLIEVRDEDRARFDEQLRRQRRFEPVPLRFQLTDEEAATFAVHRHEFPGVELRATLTRFYPHGEIAAHAVGYVGAISAADLGDVDAAEYSGTSHYGKTGVELAHEARLHGAVGHRQVETNAQGRVLRVLDYVPPTAGDNLYLTLDVAVQQAAEAALGDRAGAVVAIDPRNGDVLALVSRPGFDPNLFVDGISVDAYRGLEQDPDRPLFNRVLRGRYPPGSTIKPFLGLAAIQYGTELSRRSVYCEGYYRLPGGERRYRDWKRSGHGRTDLHRAISESCDVYFYELALELDIDRMHAFMTAAGFGRPTGIDLVGELSGLMPSREWKRRTMNQSWFPGETLIVGIGQGYMLATPIQLAYSTALAAGRGHAFQPRIVGWVESGVGGRPLPESPVAHAPLLADRPADWRRIVDAMIGVVHGAAGNARAIASPDYRIAGKSGTAQVYSLAQDDESAPETEDVAEHLRDHALFIAFAPADHPRIAVAVVVEHGGGGSSKAAPVARAVMDAWLEDAGDD